MGERRLALIGEQPGGNGPYRPELALTGPTGRNLCAIAGWDWDEYLRADRRNVFDLRVATWNSSAARKHALDIAMEVQGTRILLLGARVAEAFGVLDVPNYWWTWRRVGYPDLLMARIPHPSGRCRAWNDPSERAWARLFLEGLL